jgi:RHS repeat-associated protein
MGDWGPAFDARVSGPRKIAFDSRGNFYVTESWVHPYGATVQAVKGFQAVGSYAQGSMHFADGSAGHSFDGTGRHLSSIDLATGALLASFDYDTRGRLVAIADASGNTATIARDSSGRALTITAPDGQVTAVTIDAGNTLRRVDFPDGTGWHFTYAAGGLLDGITDPNGNTARHFYDDRGRLTTIVDPDGNTFRYTREYEDDGALVTTAVTPEGDVRTFHDAVNTQRALVSTYTAPDGSTGTQTVSRDLLSETEQTACGMTVTSRFGVEPTFQDRYVKELKQTTPSGKTKTLQLGITYQDQNSDGEVDKSVETLAVNGRSWSATRNGLTGGLTLASPAGRTASGTFDATTLAPLTLSVPGLYTTNYTYDGRGRLKTLTVGSRAASLWYDGAGYLYAVTLPDGKWLHFTRDTMGRLLTEQRPDGSTVSYTYDANGNVTALVTPTGSSFGFSYTADDQREAFDLPLSGSYAYGYDADGRLLTIDAPSGDAIVNAYEEGHLVATLFPEGQVDYTWACGGKLSRIAKGTSRIDYTWDGPLLTSDIRTGLVPQTIGYAYDNDFRLASWTYAGSAQSRGYDADGLLTTAGSFTITRNANNGLPVSVTNGTVSIGRTFSGYGELDGATWTVAGKPVYRWEVPERDGSGRTIRRSEAIGGETIEWGYAYDAAGRLVEVTRNGALAEAYTYDANGNRLTETNAPRGITGKSFSYSAEDHVLTAGDTSYQFDVDGFATSKSSPSGTTSYSYSSRGELLSTTLPSGAILTYDHDPLGRRIAKRVNGAVVEKYLWADLTTLLATYGASGNLIARFSYVDDRVPYAMTKGGVAYYLAYDQVGSLRAVSDAAGTVVKRIDYDSFGNIVADTNPGFAVPFGFAGGLQDRDAGLVRFGFRDYEPGIGKWTARDPIDFAGGDTDLYAYVMNDPVNWVDPGGLTSLPDRITQATTAADALTGVFAYPKTPTGAAAFAIGSVADRAGFMSTYFDDSCTKSGAQTVLSSVGLGAAYVSGSVSAVGLSAFGWGYTVGDILNRTEVFGTGMTYQDWWTDILYNAFYR